MKKQILSLLLVLLIVPSVFLFAGCKDDSYKLNNLKMDYQNMVSGCENIKCENNKIVFDYSSHTIGSNSFMNQVIQIEPYNQLNNYNELFDNLMGFVYEYIEVCSNNNINVDAEFRNKLKSELDDLSSSLRSVDVYVNQWVETVEFNYVDNDLLNIQCLSRYRYLLSAYNELYQKAINFSNSVANLYYNYALNDPNPRIDNISLEEFDASIVLAKLQGRVRYVISNLSQIYVEKHIDGLNIEETITTNNNGSFGKLYLDKDFYSSDVSSLERVLDSDFDVDKVVDIANGESKKQNFYNISIRVYNLQNIIKNENDLFVLACNNIQYGKESDQNRNKYIIDNYAYITGLYHDTLESMLNWLDL